MTQRDEGDDSGLLPEGTAAVVKYLPNTWNNISSSCAILKEEWRMVPFSIFMAALRFSTVPLVFYAVPRRPCLPLIRLLPFTASETVLGTNSITFLFAPLYQTVFPFSTYRTTPT